MPGSSPDYVWRYRKRQRTDECDRSSDSHPQCANVGPSVEIELSEDDCISIGFDCDVDEAQAESNTDRPHLNCSDYDEFFKFGESMRSRWSEQSTPSEHVDYDEATLSEEEDNAFDHPEEEG